jgi:hypothetical protein
MAICRATTPGKAPGVAARPSELPAIISLPLLRPCAAVAPDVAAAAFIRAEPTVLCALRRLIVFAQRSVTYRLPTENSRLAARSQQGFRSRQVEQKPSGHE